MLSEGWIKIDRNLLKWRWFSDTPTLVVWIYLLLQANYEERDFKTITIHRGELVRSQAQIAADTGLSLKNVRTALEHLEATGEVARRRHGQIVVISIPNYDRYQDNRQENGSQTADNRQENGSQTADNRQTSGADVRKKEGKKGRREGGAKRPASSESLYMRAVRWQREAEEELAAEEAAEAAEDDQ